MEQKLLVIFRGRLQPVILLLTWGVPSYALRIIAETNLIRFTLVRVTTAIWSPITRYVVFAPYLLGYTSMSFVEQLCRDCSFFIFSGEKVGLYSKWVDYFTIQFETFSLFSFCIILSIIHVFLLKEKTHFHSHYLYFNFISAIYHLIFYAIW